MRKFILLPVLSAFLVLSFIKLLLAAGFTPQSDIKPAKNLAVVELFTSQSCSSCPPADHVLASIADDPNIIALSFHVTYWNYLHWKDTLSHEFATKRQRAIAAYQKSRRVYTPQMVVNGADEFVGSRTSPLNSALNRAAPVEIIDITRSGETLTLSLPDAQTGNYTLWLAGVKNTHTQAIPSGENRGRTVTYRNAVLSFKSHGTWNGASDNRTITITPTDGVDHYVVLAQENSYGKILAAGRSN